MEVLRRRRWITDLQIIFGTELKITLKSSTRVLRSLTFVTMWQEHHESRCLFPFILRRRDVLIDDCLRTVPKVAKLRLPKNQGTLRDYRITIFESQHTFFRYRTVKHFEASLRIRFRSQLRKGRPGFSCLRVVKHSMPLTKSSTSGILTT